MKTKCFSSIAKLLCVILLFISSSNQAYAGFIEDPNCVPPTGGIVDGEESSCEAYESSVLTNVESPIGTDCGGPTITGEDTCDSGDKPTTFILEYNGESCADSDNSQGDLGSKWDCNESGNGPNGETEVYIETNDDFSGLVSLGSSITITNGGSNLSNPVEFSIYNEEGGDLLQYVEIHTSCSAPIVIGDQFGSLVLNEVIYENGEVFGGPAGISYQWQRKIGSGSWENIEGATGLEYDPGKVYKTSSYRRVTSNCCGTDFSNTVTKTVHPLLFTNAGSDANVCDGGAVNLTADLSVPSPHGFILKAEPEDGSDTKAKFKTGGNGPKLKIYLDGNPNPIIVESNAEATVEDKDQNKKKNDELKIETKPDKNKRSLVDFDLGNISGNVDQAVLVLKSDDDKTIDVGVYPIVEDWFENEATWLSTGLNQDWENPGILSSTTPLLDVQTISDKVEYEWDVTSFVTAWISGSISPGPFSYSWSNGANSQNNLVSPFVSTIYGLTVTDLTTGCLATDEVLVEVSDESLDPGIIEGQQSACESFDPSELTSTHDGLGECGSDIVEDCCENGDKPISFKLKYNGENCIDSDNNQGDLGGKWDCTGDANGDLEVYIETNDDFSGTVTLGSSFTVTNGGSNLSNPVELSIYAEEGGVLLQYIEIHTSCSAPIVGGDQFGSLILQETIFEDGYVCEGLMTDIEFQWQSMISDGDWEDIPNENAASYDPPILEETTSYRRLANNCCGQIASNVIEVTVLGKISGSVFIDTDNDNDPDEVLADVQIILLDHNGDPAEDFFGNLVSPAFTDGQGSYIFSCLEAGMYYVVEVQPEGYEDVLDDDMSDDDLTDSSDLNKDDNIIPVELSSGELDADNDFIEKLSGSISGYVYKLDALVGDDGDLIPFLIPLENVPITLFDNVGGIVDVMQTGADGFYIFENLPSGIYTVVSPEAADDCADFSDEDASTRVNDTDGAPDPVDNQIPVVLTSGESDEDNNFIDQFLGTISGSVSKDLDLDGGGDIPLANVEVKLLDTNLDPAIDAFGDIVISQFTDDDGDYEFENLGAGDYIVMEIQSDDLETVRSEDLSDDDVADGSDPNIFDDMIPVVLESAEDDADNDFINRDPINDTFTGGAESESEGSASNRNQKKTTITVYPNPVVETARISINNDQKVQVEVYNLLGHIVLEKVVKNGEELNFQGFPAAQYLMKVMDLSGQKLAKFRITKAAK